MSKTGRTPRVITVKAPLTGNLMPIEEVPDQVFARKLVGDGVAVDPSEGLVVAPVAARVETVFPSGHAVVLRPDPGVAVLIHVGIGTVRLARAFEKVVQAGIHVREGDVLLRFDLDIVRREAESAVSPVVILNPPAGLCLRHCRPRPVRAGEDAILSILLPDLGRVGMDIYLDRREGAPRGPAHS
ncbi:MAG: PTS glucose transporter subunit IIA [Ignavibacteriales bacterium]